MCTCKSLCLTVAMSFIWVRRFICCICLLVVKDHERNHSDYVQLKTQSGSLLPLKWQGKGRGGATKNGHYSPTCV